MRRWQAQIGQAEEARERMDKKFPPLPGFGDVTDIGSKAKADPRNDARSERAAR